MINQIVQPQWVSIKSETREQIRKILGVPKTGSALVETDSFGKSHVFSDGCTNSDLQSLTAQKMMDFLEGDYTPEDTVYTLFEKVVAKVEGKEEVTTEATTTPTEAVKDLNKCEFCEYTNANKRAVGMHKLGKHRNR